MDAERAWNFTSWVLIGQAVMVALAAALHREQLGAGENAGLGVTYALYVAALVLATTGALRLFFAGLLRSDADR